MSIVFYISGHGFGHASRDVEIINALGRFDPPPVVIRTSVDPALLDRTIRVPYQLRPGICDTGIIQSSSVDHDDGATVSAALDFYRNFSSRIDSEIRALADLDVDLIVGDIPPLAFATAAMLGVPSVAVGNFTWDWIYETHPGFLPEGAPVLGLIRDCYRRADLALELPFSGGFDVFERVEPLPLVARRATQPRDATREFFGLPKNGPVVLLSFGGYGLPRLDLSTVDCRDDWTVVTTDRVISAAEGLPHVRMVNERQFHEGRFRYEDLVAAIDVVMSKPGYGIVAECISTGTGLVYTSRGVFREYDVLVRGIQEHLRSAFISHDDLFAGRWRHALNAVLAAPKPVRTLDTSGAEAAAAWIARAVSGAV